MQKPRLWKTPKKRYNLYLQYNQWSLNLQCYQKREPWKTWLIKRDLHKHLSCRKKTHSIIQVYHFFVLPIETIIYRQENILYTIHSKKRILLVSSNFTCYKNTKHDISVMCMNRAKIPVFINLWVPSCKEVLPLSSPVLTNSLLPVPVDAETLTDNEPTLKSL